MIEVQLLALTKREGGRDRKRGYSRADRGEDTRERRRQREKRERVGEKWAEEKEGMSMREGLIQAGG